MAERGSNGETTPQGADLERIESERFLVHDAERQRSLAGNLYRNLRILAVLTVLFLAVLALAPLKWHQVEWREAQRDYNRRAREAGLRPVSVGLKQVWRPEIDLTDRCMSCHLGMGAAAPLSDGGSLHGEHPEVHHDVARMGCTLCHRGQGRATTRAAAHGEVEHWEDPMLAKDRLQASCGGCHGDAVRTPPTEQVERGAYLFELHGCQACHVVDGEGGGVGPDLSGVALKGFDHAWHVRHLREPTAVVEGSRMMSFGHLSDEEIETLLAYLDTLIGAPQLVRGKAITVELGCRGCHKIGGLGGDVSVDLNEAARKSVAEYDFSHVEGEHTLENWHRQHLRDPQRVAPGSSMPPVRLPAEEEEALLTYVLSLRRPEIPLEQLPRETILAELEERRDFSWRAGTDPQTAAERGRALFGVFCSACHGRDGRGQVMETLGTTVPDVRNPTTLAVYSPRSQRYTIEHGRPGRSMPAWGASGAALRDQEIADLVAFLRSDLAAPPSFAAVRAAPADARHGGRLFAQDCAACHGARGEGTEIAPSLSSPELHFAATDRYFYETITQGRPGTAMPAHLEYDARSVASLVRFIRDQGAPRLAARRRELEGKVREVLFVSDLEQYRANGSRAYGEILFRSMCAGCHGAEGRGGLGPAIANPAFLRVASDGFLAGTIVLGRSERAMQEFGPHGLAVLAEREVGDLIAYLRHTASTPQPKPGYRTVQGTYERGEELYARYCVGCHGEEGAGRTGPALRNPAFLDSVTDGFLQATLVQGRPGTAMRSWARGGYGFAELEPIDINDLVTYIRSWQQ